MLLSPKSCCILGYQPAQVSYMAWRHSHGAWTLWPWSHPACASSNPTRLLRKAWALSCFVLPHSVSSSGTARRCCPFGHSTTQVAHFSIHRCWLMALGLCVTAGTCRHIYHQLVSLKAPQRLQSHQPQHRAICLVLPALSPPGDRDLESGTAAGARQSLLALGSPCVPAPPALPSHVLI